MQHKTTSNEAEMNTQAEEKFIQEAAKHILENGTIGVSSDVTLSDGSVVSGDKLDSLICQAIDFANGGL